MAEPLNITILGAGLGGLGCAISLALSGHRITVLESSSKIAEIGAGIQILPNASRILLDCWGMRPLLAPHYTAPRCVNMLRWTGELISSMDFRDASQTLGGGSPFWDFHRANLHKALYERAVELGANVRTGAKVTGIRFPEEGERGGRCTVVLDGGEEVRSELVVGADGIFSKSRECLLGREDPPQKTGDLAYRLLLDTKEMMKDPELAEFVKDPQVNYWLGPDCHAVNYVLRGGRQLNMVLLCPDDIPDDIGATTVPGPSEPMRKTFSTWDPRIRKLLALSSQGEVLKWKLCIRADSDVTPWSHPSGTFVLLGDSVHATLPYLASGAGMALEDAAVLGECLDLRKAETRGLVGQGRKSKAEWLRFAVTVYETARKRRTAKVVERGNVQQTLYHLHDGPEQRERDEKMRRHEAGEALAWRDKELAPWLLGYRVVDDVERTWKEVEKMWARREATNKESSSVKAAGVAEGERVRSSL